MRYDQKDLISLSSEEFERLVARVWRRMGYDTEITKASADEGIDVLATRGRQIVAIQAKCYGWGNHVGVRAVREYSSLQRRPEITRVVIVTSSRFTARAKKEADQFQVEIVDGEELLALVDRLGVRIAGGDVRRHRRIIFYASAMAAILSGLLVHLGIVLHSPPLLAAGASLAALLVCFVGVLVHRRLASIAAAPTEEVGSEEEADEPQLGLPFDEDTPTHEPLHQDLRTKEDVLRAYGKPDLTETTGPPDRQRTSWRYRIPPMAFLFDEHGRIVARFP